MDTPTLDYRQHSANSFGANTGVRSARHRLGLVKQGWHRQEAARLSRLALEVADTSRVGELRELGRLLEAEGLRARIRLVRRAPQMRRRRRDQVLIAGLVATGLW
jgi:rhamnosyltransferase